MSVSPPTDMGYLNNSPPATESQTISSASAKSQDSPSHALQLAIDRRKKLASEVQAILEKADSFELISIQPHDHENATDTFRGWKVLGRTTVREANAK